MLTSISNTRAFPLLLVLFGLFLSLSCCPVFAASKYFADITDEIGLDFRHVNGFSAERRFVEMVGNGGALFDYDNDGDLDLYLVQGNYLLNPDSGLTNKLYRNEGHHLTDVTKASGLGNNQYGIGVTTSDYDGDGYRDLYLTNFGSNVLYRNNGDGTFTDVTQIAGVTCPHLSTSAAWADIDLDGDLDLYVCNYVTYTVEDEKPCYFKDIRIYCGPLEYPGITDRLFQNNGDGTFPTLP